MNPFQIEFLKSAALGKDFPEDLGCEVAFAGRSNAGKSSAINAISNIHGLARTSKTPGRTQLINFFQINENHRLVDLPGYGYAKVPASVKERWQKTLSIYLNYRLSLKGLVLLMDIRHPLKEFDMQMLEWCVTREPVVPVHILLTKADKLNRGPAIGVLQKVKNAIKDIDTPISIQLFSSVSKNGVEGAQTQIMQWLT